MDILSYLIELVRTNKAVGVVGLGTFYKEKTPGRYDVNQHAFIPPSFEQKFTTAVTEHDLLVESLVEGYKISPESARSYITAFSEEITLKLKNEARADVAGLGTLLISATGEVNFVSSSASDAPEYFGFPIITAIADVETGTDDQPLVESTDTPTELNEDDHQVHNPHALAIASEEIKVPIQPDSANIWHFDRSKSGQPEQIAPPLEDKYKQHAGMATWIKVVIAIVTVILLALVAFYLVRPEFFNYDSKLVDQPIDPSTTSQPVLAAKDTISVANSLPIIPDSLVKDSVDLIPAVTTPDTSVTWEVIGASLTRKEVNRYIADMKARGINAKAVTMPGKGRVKMSIATYPTEESAREGRKTLSKKLKNNDLYIYQNKHTHKPLKP